MPGSHSTSALGVQISVAELGVIQNLMTDYLQPAYSHLKGGEGINLTQQELDFYFGNEFRAREFTDFHQQFQALIMGESQLMCLGEEFQVELNPAQAAFARSVLLFSQRIQHSTNPEQAKVLARLLSKIDVSSYADFVASGQARRFRQHEAARRRWAGMDRSQAVQDQLQVISSLSMTVDFYERAIAFTLKKLLPLENLGALDRTWLQNEGSQVVEDLKKMGIYLWLVEGVPSLQEVEAVMESEVAPLLQPGESVEQAEIEILRVRETDDRQSTLVVFVQSTSPYKKIQAIEIDWVFITNLSAYFKVMDFPLRTQEEIRRTLYQARQKGLGFYVKQALIAKVAILQLQDIREILSKEELSREELSVAGQDQKFRLKFKAGLLKRVISELEKLQPLHDLLMEIDRMETHFGRADLSDGGRSHQDSRVGFSGANERFKAETKVLERPQKPTQNESLDVSPDLNAAFHSLVDDIANDNRPVEQAVLDFAARLITSEDRPDWATSVDMVIHELQNQGPYYDEIRDLTGDHEHFDRIIVELRRFGYFVSGSRRHRRSKKEGPQFRH
ncbi:MAG: hypothetical protein H7A32_03540 [Deltaproteobacteria bacterium]|nr:hypothetical protein [Deltaproteobacteria bacterium]